MSIDSRSMEISSGSDACRAPSEVIMIGRRRRVGFARRTPVFGMNRPASCPPDARGHLVDSIAANKKPPDGIGRL